MSTDIPQDRIEMQLEWMLRRNQPSHRNAKPIELVSFKLTHRVEMVFKSGEQHWVLNAGDSHGLFGWQLGKIVHHPEPRGTETVWYASDRVSFHLLDSILRGLEKLNFWVETAARAPRLQEKYEMEQLRFFEESPWYFLGLGG
jgi:hypothetical protein